MRIVFFLALFMLAACRETEDENSHAEEKDALLKVVATNYPLLYFTQRIGGDRIDISYPFTKVSDSGQFIPKEKQILELQAADLIIRNGAGFEPWIDELNIPETKIINTSVAFTDQYLKLKPEKQNQGTDQEPSHAETASITWLNFRFAGQQAYEIKNKLVEIQPENKDYFEENYGSLALDLSQLNRKAIEILDPHLGMRFYCSSPIYQYFGQAYLIDIQSLTEEMLPQEEGLKILLANPEKEAEATMRYRPKGFRIVLFDPCIRQPLEGDFISIMSKNLENLESALEAE